jgi:hypothetical protein
MGDIGQTGHKAPGYRMGDIGQTGHKAPGYRIVGSEERPMQWS